MQTWKCPHAKFGFFLFSLFGKFIQHTIALPCPAPTPNLSSKMLDDNVVQVFFTNTLIDDIILIWMTYEGEEQISSTVGSGDIIEERSFSGHAFRARSFDNHLLLEYIISRQDTGAYISIESCDGVEDLPLFEKGRDEEFNNLIIKHPFNCEPSGDSSIWSCIRRVSEEEQSLRHPNDYGFGPDEIEGERKAYQITDDVYIEHIPLMPSLTKAGYVLMDSTTKVKDCLWRWWEHAFDNVELHEPIPGHYTNLHSIPIKKLDLDAYQDVRLCIISDLKQIMQWWIGRKLKHSATFGMRIYQRDSMLINHVDRAETHMASAIIQVVQETDFNRGWPLELVNDDGELLEIYLQPGQMLIYEGARLMHGRPMRFQGAYYGNVFSHFTPLDWLGPHEKQPEWVIKDNEGRLKAKVEKHELEHDEL